MNRIKWLIRVFGISFTITSFVFLFIPEKFFSEYFLIFSYNSDLFIKIFDFSKLEEFKRILISKIFFYFVIIIVSFIVYFFFTFIIWFTVIKGNNSYIVVKYCDLFKCKKAIPIIHFDECFITKVGEKSGEIKKDSICGRYLDKHPDINVKKMLDENSITPGRKKSEYQNKECYKSGTIVRNDDALLMAFAKLDKDGLAYFESEDEYLKCLSFMWSRLCAEHGSSDVCMTAIGSGRTKIGQRNYSQQEVLDLIIMSYKLSAHKLQNNYKLIICCKRESNFSFGNILAKRS